VLQAISAITGRKTRAFNTGKLKPHHNDRYRLSIRQGWQTKRGGAKITKLKYNGDVACLSVPSSFVLVRDGGVPLICGQCNFGLPGGMGPPRLQGSFKEDGINISLDQAKRYKQAWIDTWAEARPYLDYMSARTRTGDTTLEQLRSGRIRGRVGYSDGLNSYFQGLTSDGAKAAMWQIQKECYVLRESPLYGARMVLFLHDEFILECREENCDAVARRLKEIMISEMKKFLPDVPVDATPICMRRWVKGAKPVFVDGKLVPGRAEKKDGKVLWVPDVLEKRRAA
jgi:hypothetical protein